MMNKRGLSRNKKGGFISLFRKLFSDRKKIVVLIILLVGAGWFGWRGLAAKKEKPQYQTTEVTRGMVVSSVSASGEVLSANIINVTTKASGIVKEVYVKNGDKVKKGDKILEIDLDLEGKQRYASAWSSYLSAKNSLESAKASLYSLDSQMWAAHRKFMDDAVARSLASEDPTYIQQNDDWLAAEAKYKNQRQVIAQAEANVNSSWLNYIQASPIITAPSDGIIISLMFTKGMSIGASNTSNSASSQKVAAIKTEGAPIVSVNLSEVDVPVVKSGQKATVILDSIPDETFAGEVVSVDRVGQITSGVTQYSAVIQLDSSSEQILPNMMVTANIIIDRKDNVLLVPSSAIKNKEDQNYVTLLKDGKLQPVPVKTGLSSDTQTEIISGLKEGDLVVNGTISSTELRRDKVSPFGGMGSMMKMAPSKR